MRGIGLLKRWRKYLTMQPLSQTIILVYHRIAQLSTDPQLLAVSPKHFSQHLEVLRSYYNPISVMELIEGIKQKKIPDRAVVVTFDDGYRDALYTADPLLKKYGIPATLFVTSGYIGSDQEFWWDELERIFLEPGILPNNLELIIRGKSYMWKLGKAATYETTDYEKYCGWTVLEPGAPTSRQAVYRELHSLLRPLGSKERLNLLLLISDWAGRSRGGRPTHALLGPEELVQFADSHLCEVGAHTLTHPMLAELSEEDQEREIQGSKSHLERLLGRRITFFSYPYGSLKSYTDVTKIIVQRSGFTCAFSTIPGKVSDSLDCFGLPRLTVRNWGMDEFARWLRKFH